MNKIIQKVVTKDYKKGLLRYLIVTLVFLIAAGGIGYIQFGARLHALSYTLEQSEKTQEIETYKTEIKHVMNFTTGEKILVGAIAGIGMLLFLYFWILIIGLTIKKCKQYGADYLIFGFLAACVNVGALIVLYIYKHFANVCEKCGKIQKRKAAYCSDCGTSLVNTCQSCGNHDRKDKKYCSQCGSKY